MASGFTKENIFDRILETPHLTLRRIRESDDKDMFDYTSNPIVTKYLSWNPHSDIIQTQKYITSLIAEYNSTDSYAWAIENKKSNKLIGIVRIFEVNYANKRGELSYIINPLFQGKGLIVEALKAVVDISIKEAGLNRIQAKCTPDNYASERVMQKLGMSYEGTLKQFWINKGIFMDAKIYALTANDYMK